MMTAVADTEGDILLQTLGREIMKVYRVYDGSDRLVTQYEAVANCEHGKPCVKTEYTYVGATTRIEKMKESQATWDSSYDI